MSKFPSEAEETPHLHRKSLLETRDPYSELHGFGRKALKGEGSNEGIPSAYYSTWRIGPT